MLLDSFLILLSYLLGSVSSAIIVCRLMGLPDPRQEGSGNPGATNVLRIGGKKAAALTLMGDLLKGYVPVWLALMFDLDATLVILIGVAAFVGHLWPIFFGFSGGKGVATELGVLFALHPLVGTLVAAIWLLIAKGLKISSLAALVAMVCAPAIVWWLVPEASRIPWVAGVSAMSMVLLVRHKDNIQRLLNGEEGRIGQRNQ